MKITTGGYEVFLAGSVITWAGEPITFDLSHDFKISMRFVDDTILQPADHKLTYTTLELNHLEITCHNFIDSGGTSNITPLSLGDIDGRRVYLNFTARPVIGNKKLLSYSWYFGKETINAGN